MRLHCAYMQVHSGPLRGAPRQPWGMENPSGYNLGWLGTTLQCLMVVSSGHGGQHRIVYSDLVGYHTSDIRLLWTITPNPPPPPTQTPFLPPPPPVSDFPPPVSPPISDLSHCHHTLEV